MKPILKKQLPPTHVKLEFTEGCNLYCDFCPIHSIRNGPGNLKFMNMTTLNVIIEQLSQTGWSNKIECTGHGEPLLNHNHLKYYRKLREAFPKAYIFTTSNGGPLLKNPTKMIDVILQYVNVLALDDYKHSGFVPKVLEKYKGKNRIFVYPEMPTYTKPNTKEHYVVVYPDISQVTINERCLSNTACNAGPPDYKYINKTCHRPFRELDIANDGTVIFCCYDWVHEHPIANIHDMDLEDIWQHRRFKAGRRILHHEGRKFGICYGCDNRLYRIGLLPDRMGKFTLAKPSKLDWRIIKRIEEEAKNKNSCLPKNRRKKSGIRESFDS
jgi:MoaA/NifB/PqqE/SkfB family radical SAM enzyme